MLRWSVLLEGIVGAVALLSWLLGRQEAKERRWRERRRLRLLMRDIEETRRAQ